MGQSRHLHRIARREGSDYRAERWDGHADHSQAADPPARQRTVAVRDQPRRRILLFARAAGVEVARRWHVRDGRWRRPAVTLGELLTLALQASIMLTVFALGIQSEPRDAI